MVTANHVPAGKPPAVIVTVLDEKRFGAKYTELLKENRRLYAEKHGMLHCECASRKGGRGRMVKARTSRMAQLTLCPRGAQQAGYTLFFPQAGDYELAHAPTSWTKVVAMRHALTQHPEATYFWYVDVDTFIMNPQMTVETDLMAPNRLEERMIVDHPVVPPDSIIKTFGHLRGDDIDFVLTQDGDGLATSSFVLRNSEWARFFLETWFDPMYRSYNFQKAETHALVGDLLWGGARRAGHCHFLKRGLCADLRQ